jgi:hypothetical protein
MRPIFPEHGRSIMTDARAFYAENLARELFRFLGDLQSRIVPPARVIDDLSGHIADRSFPQSVGVQGEFGEPRTGRPVDGQLLAVVTARFSFLGNEVPGLVLTSRMGQADPTVVFTAVFKRSGELIRSRPGSPRTIRLVRSQAPIELLRSSQVRYPSMGKLTVVSRAELSGPWEGLADSVGGPARSTDSPDLLRATLRLLQNEVSAILFDPRQMSSYQKAVAYGLLAPQGNLFLEGTATHGGGRIVVPLNMLTMPEPRQEALLIAPGSWVKRISKSAPGPTPPPATEGPTQTQP